MEQYPKQYHENDLKRIENALLFGLGRYVTHKCTTYPIREVSK